MFEKFEPIIVESLNDIETAFRQDKQQIFIFDDAFGKYSLSFESREWFSRLTYLFDLADKDHLFIFTSREYIFREFVNLGNEAAKDFLDRILVESHAYLEEEKMGMLDRYTRLSTLSGSDKSIILLHERELVNHKNFSPETIRAFFSGFQINNERDILKSFKSHLDQPDSYLGNVFRSLPIQKQGVLIALLCSVQNNMGVLKTTYSTVCADLSVSALLNAEVEFDELDDSIVRITRGNSVDVVRFYHPSMAEFLVRQIVERDAATLKDVIFKNINSDLLSLCQLCVHGGTNIAVVGKRDVCIENTELAAVETGIVRLIDNDNCPLSQITEVFGWFGLSQHTLDIKLSSPPYFKRMQLVLSNVVSLVFSESFFWRHRDSNSKAWSGFLRSVNNSIRLCAAPVNGLNVEPLRKLLIQERGKPFYWTLVFRSLYFLGDSAVLEVVGRDWLNDFYKALIRDINELALEVFGDDYPKFTEYEYQTKVLKKPYDKMRTKPNKTWYSRFLKVEDRVDVLKEIKGHQVGNAILERLTDRYDHIVGLKDYAKNRYRFIVGRGWWNNVPSQEDED